MCNWQNCQLKEKCRHNQLAVSILQINYWPQKPIIGNLLLLSQLKIYQISGQIL